MSINPFVLNVLCDTHQPKLNHSKCKYLSHDVLLPSQLHCFARLCSKVSDFNKRSQSLTAKLLVQGGISEPVFYGDLVYKFK